MSDQQNRLVRRREAELHQRVVELENTLRTIRDKWCPALKRDAREADKTHCNASGIEYDLAKVIPLYKFPKEAQL